MTSRLLQLTRVPRITGLDAARGIAVLGMMGAHMATRGAEFSLRDPATWQALVHGHPSILFALLAGVSVALMTGGTTPPPLERRHEVRARLVGRGIAIFLIGLVLELLGSAVAVILCFYGVLYVAVLPFLRWRGRWLWTAVLVLAVTGPAWMALRHGLGLTNTGTGAVLVFDGVYALTTWLPLLLAGLAVGRADLTRLFTGVALAAGGAALCAAAFGLSAAVAPLISPTAPPTPGDKVTGEVVDQPPASELDGSKLDAKLDAALQDAAAEKAVPEPKIEGDLRGPNNGWETFVETVQSVDHLSLVRDAWANAQPHSGGTLEMLGSGGFGAALLGVCLLIARVAAPVLLPLAVVGSMPLTAYAAHVLVILVLAGPQGTLEDSAAWGWTSLGMVLGCASWISVAGRGPLERLVARSATWLTPPATLLAADVPAPVHREVRTPVRVVDRG